MHLSLIGLVDFADLSLGMVMFHLFTFDPAWLKPGEGGRVFYDGGCALCQTFVRLVLAEDKGERLRLAPLGGASFTAANPPPGLPDSVLVLTADGRWLARSRAVLHALRALGGAWRLLAAAASLAPVSWADRVYDFTAARRRKFAGACPVPPASLRRRLAA
jgi:predicted DCC family thiol-disulfide oxidoreductase YuxK